MSALRYVAIASLFLSAAISADEDRSRPRIKVEALNPWTHLDLVNDPENFQFAIVTDRTGGHRAGVFPDAMRKLNLLQPEFVMSVGDPVEGYTE
ncbi:MAG: serine/threonine protein phosphatase, partial [Armatimonadetes bacterium]|nr:serine/threonine protein phosphatase [Armatimonadota bacterium]